MKSSVFRVTEQPFGFLASGGASLNSIWALIPANLGKYLKGARQYG